MEEGLAKAAKEKNRKRDFRRKKMKPLPPRKGGKEKAHTKTTIRGKKKKKESGVKELKKKNDPPPPGGKVFHFQHSIREGTSHSSPEKKRGRKGEGGQVEKKTSLLSTLLRGGTSVCKL